MWTRCGLDVKKIAAADGAEVAGETKEVNGNRDNVERARIYARSRDSVHKSCPPIFLTVILKSLRPQGLCHISTIARHVLNLPVLEKLRACILIF